MWLLLLLIVLAAGCRGDDENVMPLSVNPDYHTVDNLVLDMIAQWKREIASTNADDLDKEYRRASGNLGKFDYGRKEVYHDHWAQFHDSQGVVRAFQLSTPTPYVLHTLSSTQATRIWERACAMAGGEQRLVEQGFGAPVVLQVKWADLPFGIFYDDPPMEQVYLGLVEDYFRIPQ
jgi:hypothetical protein